jgi:hypothetical protein
MITIVSGMPRSGTSLMMQMLAAGGLPFLSDGERRADEDNPRGYYEWERIKTLPRDPECIAEAEGKVVKVISQLLFALPRRHDYQIIFMERPLAEVMASQAEMIQRRGTAAPALPQSALQAGLQMHLNQVQAWMKASPHIPVQRIAYRELLADPPGTAQRLADFLHCPLDTAAMAAQVDNALYRHRTP